ncbi:DUF1090 domain-containing protein [Variovorax sp. J22P271]|uniref:DUF1090 domain-containing protein n=1 Tax=Variovorax davisae TaxID=3053515 RepID=UPI002578C639|nr:DUF1090 domain-containing protein [Variovorax sp. J22P271]MDM0035051.1 DUF1090 domain-containing protein [Variovorax sp. J22P271]
MRTLHHLFAAGVLGLSLGAAAQPPAGGPCRAKYDEINAQLAEAKAQGQRQRARGLQRALDEVSRSCTDDRLKAEHAQRIRKQEQEVARRQRDLEQAQKQGRSDKVASRQAKLQAAQDELARLSQP